MLHSQFYRCFLYLKLSDQIDLRDQENRPLKRKKNDMAEVCEADYELVKV